MKWLVDKVKQLYRKAKQSKFIDKLKPYLEFALLVYTQYKSKLKKRRKR